MVPQLGLEPKPPVQCSVLHQPSLLVAMGSGRLQETGLVAAHFNFQQRALGSLTIILVLLVSLGSHCSGLKGLT